jgi:hypothetical protein
MGIFDFAKDIIGDVATNATDSISESLGGIVEVPAIQDIQDQLTSATDAVANSKDSVVESGTNAVDDIRQNIGL